MTEEIRVEHIALESSEFFAGRFRHIQILGSPEWPTDTWRLLAQLETANTWTHELFDVRDSCGLKGCWARYLKIRMLSSHASPYQLCALNRFQVFGSNVLHSLESELKEDETDKSPSKQDITGSNSPIELSRLQQRDAVRTVGSVIDSLSNLEKIASRPLTFRKNRELPPLPPVSHAASLPVVSPPPQDEDLSASLSTPSSETPSPPPLLNQQQNLPDIFLSPAPAPNPPTVASVASESFPSVIDNPASPSSPPHPSSSHPLLSNNSTAEDLAAPPFDCAPSIPSSPHAHAACSLRAFVLCSLAPILHNGTPLSSPAALTHNNNNNNNHHPIIVATDVFNASLPSIPASNFLSSSTPSKDLHLVHHFNQNHALLSVSRFLTASLAVSPSSDDLSNARGALLARLLSSNVPNSFVGDTSDLLLAKVTADALSRAPTVFRPVDDVDTDDSSSDPYLFDDSGSSSTEKKSALSGDSNSNGDSTSGSHIRDSSAEPGRHALLTLVDRVRALESSGIEMTSTLKGYAEETQRANWEVETLLVVVEAQNRKIGILEKYLAEFMMHPGFKHTQNNEVEMISVSDNPMIANSSFNITNLSNNDNTTSVDNSVFLTFNSSTHHISPPSNQIYFNSFLSTLLTSNFFPVSSCFEVLLSVLGLVERLLPYIVLLLVIRLMRRPQYLPTPLSRDSRQVTIDSYEEDTEGDSRQTSFADDAQPPPLASKFWFLDWLLPLIPFKRKNLEHSDMRTLHAPGEPLGNTKTKNVLLVKKEYSTASRHCVAATQVAAPPTSLNMLPFSANHATGNAIGRDDYDGNDIHHSGVLKDEWPPYSPPRSDTNHSYCAQSNVSVNHAVGSVSRLKELVSPSASGTLSKEVKKSPPASPLSFLLGK